MTPKSISELLTLSVVAAEAAGKAIIEIYEAGDFSVDTKADNSPLTIADKAAHQIICTHLTVTGLPILSEEGKHLPYEERKNWDWFWLVDPLDGTKEFIKKNGEFTVNIALMQKNKPVAGVVYAPVLQTVYYGCKETGVHKKSNGVIQSLAIANQTNMQQLLQKEIVTVVASRSHMSQETETFISGFKKANTVSMGSSLKFMLLANGSADIYPRLAPTMEWDTAAAHAILNAMNKCVYQTNMHTELTYNKPQLLNPSFIAF